MCGHYDSKGRIVGWINSGWEPVSLGSDSRHYRGTGAEQTAGSGPPNRGKEIDKREEVRFILYQLIPWLTEYGISEETIRLTLDARTSEIIKLINAVVDEQVEKITGMDYPSYKDSLKNE